MLKLRAYSPFNGYPTLADAKRNNAVYDIAAFEADKSSYTAIADAMEIGNNIANMILSDGVQYALAYNGKTIDLQKVSLDEALAWLLKENTNA